jgi:acetolactate decarboxylase
VKTRSVPRQTRPYPKLADVTAKQPTFEFADVKGTIVAFRCPYFVKSVNVPGWHLHFLDADRKRGGHLLDCRVRAATVSYETLSALRLWLPITGDFPTHLLPDAGTGSLEKVEKGR